MNGKHIAHILNEWDKGNHVSDEDLKTLHKDLTEIRDFLNDTNSKPLSHYYTLALVPIQSAIENRKNK